MEGSRFDGITRALATGQTRRQALRGVAGSALAGLLGFTGIEDAAAACVKPDKKGCDGPKNKQCCQGAHCQGGTKDKEGRCTCKGRLKQCGRTCINSKTDEKHCGGCNKRCQGLNKCTNGRCQSKLGCKAGQNVCNAPLLEDLDDPRICDTEGETCLCITDVQGGAHCSDFTRGGCSTCTSNAECPEGQVCFDASGINCACDDDPGSNGNACISATCNGLSGSGAGRTRLTTPLLR